MAVEAEPATRTPALIVVAAIGLGLLAAIISIGEALVAVLGDWHAVPRALQPDSSLPAGVVTAVVTSSVGALIAIRRPKNVIGWLLLFISLNGSLIYLPRLYGTYALYIHAGPPGAAWLAWIYNLSWPLALLAIGQPLIVLPLLFPDGRLLSRRWLIPIVLYGGLLISTVLGLFDPISTAPWPNPLGVKALRGLWAMSRTGPISILLIVAFSSGMASLVVRYRRGAEQLQQQVKWLLGAVALLFLALLAAVFHVPLLATRLSFRSRSASYQLPSASRSCAIGCTTST